MDMPEENTGQAKIAGGKRISLVNLQRERSNSFLRRVESTNIIIYSYIRGHVHVHVY